MLGFIFGLNARLGRLHYFLVTIGVAVLMTVICFVMAGQIMRGAANGVPPSIDSIKGSAIVLGIVFMLITLTIQSMRVRDIGWDPVCVIPGWIAILIVDMMLARKFPGLSLGPAHHATAVSAIVNLVFFLSLMFWPSGDDESSLPPTDAPRRQDPAPRGGTNSVAAERLARVSGRLDRQTL